MCSPWFIAPNVGVHIRMSLGVAGLFSPLLSSPSPPLPFTHASPTTQFTNHYLELMPMSGNIFGACSISLLLAGQEASALFGIPPSSGLPQLSREQQACEMARATKDNQGERAIVPVGLFPRMKWLYDIQHPVPDTVPYRSWYRQ